MGNLINEEFLASKEIMIEEVSWNNRTLAKLNRHNVAIVEAMIRNDSDYIKTSVKDAGPKDQYKGSSAYWFSKLKEVLLDNKKTEYSYEKIIGNTVEAVDRENSTHLNADNCGREEITERIVKYNKDDLITCLKNPTYKDMGLFREIENRTHAKERARKNTSFASKYCHYACFNLFEDTEYQDNYSIYDSILKTVLPMYLDYYNIDCKKYDLSDYAQYSKAIDEVRYAADELISRNGFDHLLWYYHKGRL